MKRSWTVSLVLILVALPLSVGAKPLEKRGVLISIESLTLLPNELATLSVEELEVHLGQRLQKTAKQDRVVFGYRQQIVKMDGAEAHEKIRIDRSFFLPMLTPVASVICADVRVSEKQPGHLGGACAPLFAKDFGETKTILFDVSDRTQLQMIYRADAIELFPENETDKNLDGYLVHFHTLEVPKEITRNQNYSPMAIRYRATHNHSDPIGRFGDAIYWRTYWAGPTCASYVVKHFPPDKKTFEEMDDVLVMDIRPKQVNAVVEELNVYHRWLASGFVGNRWEAVALNPSLETPNTLTSSEGHELAFDVYSFSVVPDSTLTNEN